MPYVLFGADVFDIDAHVTKRRVLAHAVAEPSDCILLKKSMVVKSR